MAFKTSPTGFHGFLIEQRVGKETRSSTLMAQIVKIEEGPAETRVLIRPDPAIEAAMKRNTRLTLYAKAQCCAPIWSVETTKLVVGPLLNATSV